MNFDDHEIWGAPVRATETPAAADASVTAASVTATPAGRLYRSAGSEPHPDAIVALPNHRRHTSAQPVEASQWATASADAAAAPITINSRIPRGGASIEDPALAEIVATPAAPSPAPALAGFTSWFKSSKPLSAIAALRGGDSEVSAGVAEPTRRAPALGQLAFATNSLSTVTFSAFVLAVTAIVGLVNAAVSGTLGLPTGVALVAATAIGAWKIEPADRWSAWVMPAYTLIVAIAVAGQFTDSAPGAKPVGQLLLITASLITLAPWLATATLLGAGIPALHKRSR